MLNKHCLTLKGLMQQHSGQEGWILWLEGTEVATQRRLRALARGVSSLLSILYVIPMERATEGPIDTLLFLRGEGSPRSAKVDESVDIE